MAFAVLLGLAGAVAVRRGLDGWPGATSKTAGLVFAGLLLAIWWLARPSSSRSPASAMIMEQRTDSGRKTVRWSMITAVGRARWGVPVVPVVPVVAGLAGAALLCAGPVLFHLADPVTGPWPRLPISWFPAWAAVVAAVAITEELVLRGTLWHALAPAPALDPSKSRNVREAVALVVTTLAFAALHVPFYGWESVPVNLAAGVVLGGLRLGTGTVLAPAVTHTVADLAGWFLL